MMARLDEATPEGGTTQLPPIKLSRVFRARRDTVFSAWSTAENVQRWFAPEGCTVSDAKVEMRIGGPFELSMRAPGVEHRLRGSFVEVTPPSRLVIDMRISDADEKPLFRAYTELDFAAVPGGTRLDVTQTYIVIDPSAAWMIAGAPEGWRSTLDNLEREVARLAG
jgi:uncharacterized protein YndB with AHSA1/START domain